MSNIQNEFLLDLSEQEINFQFRRDCYPFLISCFAVYAAFVCAGLGARLQLCAHGSACVHVWF